MPNNALKYFMWGFQHHTCSNLQRYAKDLFGILSSTLKPSVFFVGILRTQTQGSLPICIEPEDCGIDVNRFNDVDKLASSILASDPRRSIFHTAPHIQKLHEDKMKRDSVRFAVRQLVEENFKNENKISFVSESVHLENYEIFVVLQFDEDIYNSFYSLTKTKNQSSISLINSLIWTFLDESLETLYRPRAETYAQDISTDKKEILRIAASAFVDSVIYTVSGTTRAWEFFNTCNYISSLKYEGDSSIGQLVICKEDHPNIDIALKLSSPINLSEHQKVRKLLEIASKDLFLYSNGNQILGLARLQGTYDPKNEDLFIIDFLGSHKWKLVHDDNDMMIVEYTNPTLPKLKINRDIFDDLLSRIFPQITKDDLENLWRIVNVSINQKHGTLLIISSEAINESNRLKNQSTNIEPVMPDDALINNITSIDGAIVLDTHGICHSIGVILDGVATEKGTPARGARFNSAVRYVDNHPKKCVAVIISEDGPVDLYPQLRPRIRKSDIEYNIEQLKKEVELDSVDYDKYRPLMNWLSDHDFYLTQEQCAEINNYKQTFDSKLKMEVGAIYIKYNDLKPNPAMDDSYFINENN